MNGISFSDPQADLVSASAPSPITRSWARCSAQHKDLQHDPVTVGRGDLSDRFLQHASLLRAAQPEIETLAGMVANTSGIVLLTDESGVILQALGDATFLRRADQVALRPGVSWAESHLGTNGVGTALLEGRPVRVHGGEHFLPRNRILSCHGAPIRSPQGDILGVLDISCDAGRLHAYALELASMFARQVTNRLMEQANGQPDLVVFHRQPALLDSIERAQLMIQDGRIVGANDAAIHLLDTSWQQLMDEPVQNWLGSDWGQAQGDTTSLHTPHDIPLFVRSRLSSSTAMRASRHAPNTVERDTTTPTAAAAHTNTHAGHRAMRNGTALTSNAPRASSAAAPCADPGTRLRGLPPLPETLRPGFSTSLRALQAGLAVLLEGDTGTGKEIYARWLHACSDRHDSAFVAINCDALPESLIEAELFGYAPGAFTGAQRHGARGRLREANGGVLFLDEIGDMPVLLQTRLLRALQEREVQPLGADKAVPVDFLLISATNQDLSRRIRDGHFRADLYYRLQDHRVRLPALSHRHDLRAFLCAEFNRNGALDHGLTLDDSALDTLCAYAWPGNYRELHAVLRGLSINYPPGHLITATELPDTILASMPTTDATPWSGHVEQLPQADLHGGRASRNDDSRSPHDSSGEPSGPKETADTTHTLQELHASRILQAMHEHGGNVSRAARSLGIHRSTLHRYLLRSKRGAH